MNPFIDNGTIPDLNDVRKWLGGELPWKLAEKWPLAGDAEWIERYVRELMAQAKAAYVHPAERDAGTEIHSEFQAETEKGEKQVVVKLRLPVGTSERKLRLFAYSDRLKVTGLPGDGRRIVRLPCLVRPRSGKVSRQGDRMIVKFRRRPLDRDEVELFISP